MLVAEVRARVVSVLSDRLVDAGFEPASVGDDFDILQQGVVDSFEFMDLLEELEEEIGVAIDLAALDDEGLTTIGGLSRQLTSIEG